MSLNKYLFCVTASLFLPAVSGAMENLEPLVITATRTRQPVSNIAASITVISSADVKMTPAHAIDDVIRTVPGVNMMVGSSNMINPGRQSVSLLGVGRIGAAGGGSRALIMQDGVPLTNGWAGWVNWSKVPINAIERIEVMRGAGSSLYGSGAMGGVINIITRNPKERAAELDLSYGSQHAQKYNAYISNTFKDKFGVSIDYSYYETRGYKWVPLSIRGPIDSNAWSRYYNLRLKLASLGDGTDETMWWWSGNLFHDTRNHGLDKFFTLRDDMEMAGGFQHPLDGKGTITGKAFLGKNGLDSTTAKTNATRTASFFTQHLYMPTLDSGGSFQWFGPMELFQSSVTAGVDIRHIAARNNEDDYDTNGVYAASISSGGRQTTVGFFGEWSMNPLPGLLVSPSARVDFWKNHDAFQDEKDVSASLPSKSFSFFSPRLGLRYQVSDILAVRSSVYRAFVAPTLQQLYGGNRPPDNIALANPELGPEILRIGGDLGWDIALPPFHMHATAFWNEISDAIIFVSMNPTTNPNTQKLQNISGVRSRGFMIETPLNLTQKLSVSPSYTYTDSTIINFPAKPNLVGNLMIAIPRHYLGFTVGYDDPAIVNARLRGRYLSKRFGNDTNTQLLDAHFVLDISAVRRIDKNWDVYLTGENLLDRIYPAWQFGSFGALGEPLYIGLGVRMHY
ncbi:MAG: TonB-dependent receptor [bacterium]